MFSKTKFFSALLLSVLFTTVSVEAQTSKFKSSYRRKADTGVVVVAGAGISFLNSDNRGNDFRSEGLRPILNNGLGQNFNVGVMYRISPMISVLGSLDYHGFRAAEDKNSDHSNDISFRSHAYMASGSVIVNLINRYSGSGARFVVPYAKVGFGAASFTASSYLVGDGGNEIKLTALKGYPALAAIVPVGVGLDFRCSDAISIAPEVSFNITSTDYLDNMPDKVEATGKNDHFVNAAMKVSYKPSARKNKFKRRW